MPRLQNQNTQLWQASRGFKNETRNRGERPATSKSEYTTVVSISRFQNQNMQPRDRLHHTKLENHTTFFIFIFHYDMIKTINNMEE